MGMTMTQKILNRSVGQAVATGEVYFSRIDTVMTHDVGTAGIVPLLQKYGTEKLFPGVETVVVLDHFVPAANAAQAESHKLAREYAKKWKVDAFYEVGRGGICHQVLLEEGFARSGNILAATDAHVTTYGGVGCLGLGVGATDVAMILSTGKMWLRIPQTIGVELTGKLSGAAAKDLAISLLAIIPFELLNYRVVEFYGSAVASLSMDDRFCLCNMMSEGGVKSCLIAGDDIVEDYMRKHARSGWELIVPDENAQYDHRYALDLSCVRPMVAFPHHPTNGEPAERAEGIAINQAFLGSCTNGRLEDLRLGADIVRGNKVHPDVRFVVTPASQAVYLQALEEGLIRDFIESGAMVTNPSCGACIGASSLLAPGEICVATSNRNFQGRMGSVNAAIYLASPETVAKSALAGHITTK